MAQSKNLENKKVAIVCDWLVGGGAEKVVLELHNMFPDAPIFTSYCTYEWQKKLNNRVVTGYLQKWPFPHLRKFIPMLRAAWFKRLDLSNYDLVISSSGAEAKSVSAGAYVRHISYIHAPTHYYWDKYGSYAVNPGFGILNPIAKLGLKIFVRPMRRWDYEAAQQPNVLIANSLFTQKQIKKYYKRPATIVHPPIDFEKLKKINQKKQKHEGFVIVGRQVPYKRIDLAVGACNGLGMKLVVIGDGPEHRKLRQMAGPTIEFIKNATSEDLAREICAAKAFIFPGLDDFGIAPVEALALGTPVIAYKGGGALDYIKPGINGEFFTSQSVESLSKVMSGFNQDKYTFGDIRNSVKDFSKESFQRKMLSIIEKNV